MTYSIEDIELMIANLPKHRALSSLDESFTPQRRHIKAKAWYLPFFTRSRKIVNCLIEHFQDNPINPDDFQDGSGIPYFLWDLGQFSKDKDVERLMQIPNIDLVRSKRMN